jgi:hypothetical protein
MKEQKNLKPEDSPKRELGAVSLHRESPQAFSFTGQSLTGAFERRMVYASISV